MPQWHYPGEPPYSIYASERPFDQAPRLTKCRLREPLKTDEHIRLLKVYPPGWPNRLAEKLAHKDDANVKCEVFQIALEDIRTDGRPYFATLSYVWGNSKPDNQVRCGRDLVGVTRNLYEAMVYIRHLRSPRLLWIDSLCINQADEREKSQQVQRMALVYGQSHCITWLGVESKDRADLKEMLPLLMWFSDYDQSIRAQRVPLNHQTLSQFFLDQPAPGCKKLLDIPWEDLRRSLDREVFTRLWCVQEISLARSNDIRTSETHVDIHLLERVERLLHHLLRIAFYIVPSTHGLFETPSDETIIGLLDACRSIGCALVTGPRVSFLKGTRNNLNDGDMAAYIAIRCFEKECTDSRDHIYGLAALCGFDASHWLARSTVLMTAQEVFVDFTLHCLRNSNSLFLFQTPNRASLLRDKSHVHFNFQHRSWLSGLPSWCPDFAGPCARSRDVRVQDRHRTTPVESCRSRPAIFTLLSRRQVGIMGIRIAVVQTCSSTWTPAENGDDYAVWLQKAMGRAASFERCALSVQDVVPAYRFWQLYLDVCSCGTDIRHSPSCQSIAEIFPGTIRDRMAKKAVSAAWMMRYAPNLARNAGLSLNRKLHPDTWNDVAEDLDNWLTQASFGSRLFTTDNTSAILGTGPDGLYVGDIVAVLFGSDTPFILREVGNQGHYKLIGGCYVSGIMHSEALDMGLEEREFVLI